MQAPAISPSVRMYLLGATFAVCGIFLIYRLFTFQVREHESYSRLASNAHRETITVPAQRGALLDTNGYALAISVPFDAVEVVGTQIKNADETALLLAAALEMPIPEVAAKIDPTNNRAIIVKDRLPAAVADRVRDIVKAKNLSGVRLAQLPARQYPEGSIAAQVLGFVGSDGNGLTGLEVQFDTELMGTPSQIQTETDVVGRELILARRVVTPGRAGTDVVLTIDRFVQRTAESILAEAVRVNKAIGGMILVMEPSTGAILAMASAPTFALSDSTEFRATEQHLYKPVPVTNQYEPGSVMKVVTMAAGLDQNVVTPTSTVQDSGMVQIGVDKIFNWDKNGNGTITMTDVLVRSSNVGANFVASRLGKDRFYQYLDGFGFGHVTGVELPGETPGTIRTPKSADWAPVDLATNSFGQGMAVTPLQMLTAVAAIGNDGVRMQPTIVRETIVDGVVTRNEPKVARRVINANTARTLREMMVTVLEQPALQNSRIAGYRVAGKTGTADFPTNLGYTSGKTFASIAALMPAEQPRLAVLIRIDAPEAIYGGAVAAPVLKRLGQELLAYYRIPPTAATAPTTR
ncbi:MAG: penicillin-binding protein 2 [Chloroflexota bacterium]